MLSLDVKNPSRLTFSTYQSVYALEKSLGPEGATSLKAHFKK